MLEAVLEMSRQEAGLSAPPPLEDDPTSSPDTGFGDTDAHDLAYHTDLLEPDTKQPAGSPTSRAKDLHCVTEGAHEQTVTKYIESFCFREFGLHIMSEISVDS